MARLFTCGFEEIDDTVMFEVADGTLVTSPVHSGTYAIRCRGSLSEYTRYRMIPAPSSGTLYIRFYWQTTSLAFDNPMFFIKDDGGAFMLRVQKLSTGALRLENEVASTSATTTATVSTDTWYRIEVRYLIHNSTGEMELRLYLGDNTTPIETVSLTGQDTTSGPAEFFHFQENAGASYDYFYDDIAINDDSGSFQTSWCGPGNTALITAASNNSVTWTRGGGTPESANWRSVDDVPGTVTDGTDYNYDSGSTNLDRLNITALPGGMPPTATMVLMDVYARVSASASSGTLRLAAWDESSAQTNSPDITVDSATWRTTRANEKRVMNLSGKTKANVESYSIGYEARGGAVEKRVGAIWANVEWTSSNTLAGSSITGAQGTETPGITIGL